MFINFSTFTDPDLETCQVEELIKKLATLQQQQQDIRRQP
jgi:hypothetical protein